MRHDREPTSAVVKLGAAGSIDVYTSAAANIIVDVTGVFVEAPSAVSAGRFVPVDPRRVVDTRGSGQRGDVEIRVPIPAGIPGDASALAVTVTAVGAASSGYLTVYPAGGIRGETSVVNTDEHNRTRANAVFVSVSADGFMVFRSTQTDVLVDLWGWFTGPSASSSTDGLFVTKPPTRAWDSRVSFDPIHQGGTVEKHLLDAPAAAIVANVTAVDSTGWGFVSVFAAGMPLPNVSSLNYRWRQPVAALTVSRVSDRGVALVLVRGGPRDRGRRRMVHGRRCSGHDSAACQRISDGCHRGHLRVGFVLCRDPLEWRARITPGRSVRQSPGVVSPLDRCVVSWA